METTMQMSKSQFRKAYHDARSAGGAASEGNIWAMSEASGLPQEVFKSALLDDYNSGRLVALRSVAEGYPLYYTAALRKFRVAGPVGKLPN